MKTLLTCIITLLLWTSCSPSIQVTSVKSDILQQDTLLRYENDTFDIVYNLYEDGGVVSFSIHNKAKVPLYVDWKRSALIKGTQKQDYWNSAIHIKTKTTGYNIEWLNGYTRTHNRSKGVMTQEEQVTFIPPQTTITMSKFRINDFFGLLGLKDTVVTKTYKNGTTTVKTKQFDATNTPLIFRNFLTLSLKHDFSEEFYIDHSFWVDEVTEMDNRQFQGKMFIVELDRFTQYNDYEFPFRKPNNFYIKQH